MQWWYQFYFATERGQAGYDFARLIWQNASPQWKFDDTTFERSASTFDNPDHVAIVIHNYRWRLGMVEGEAKFAELESRLAEFPLISVPTITLQGDADGAPRPDPSVYAKKFSGKYQHRSVEGALATTCRKKRRRHSPRPSSMSTSSDPMLRTWKERPSGKDENCTTGFNDGHCPGYLLAKARRIRPLGHAWAAGRT